MDVDQDGCIDSTEDDDDDNDGFWMTMTNVGTLHQDWK